MRTRHGLKLDQTNDFDLITQDAFLKLWIRSVRHLLRAYRDLVDRADGRRDRRDGDHVDLGDRADARDRRAGAGARRAEILFQFLVEAAVLTSAGGLIGVALGAAIGWGVHLASGFPVSMPWWSFAIGIGFSAAVGLFFGMYPAFKASRLDPIEALRYE